MQICGYMPGSIGRIVELHGRYYARDWRFGPYFEAKVASELGEFLARLDPKRDGFWIAAEDNEIVGGIAIDGPARPTPLGCVFSSSTTLSVGRASVISSCVLRWTFAGAPGTSTCFSVHLRDWTLRASSTSATASR